MLLFLYAHLSKISWDESGVDLFGCEGAKMEVVERNYCDFASQFLSAKLLASNEDNICLFVCHPPPAWLIDAAEYKYGFMEDLMM